MRPTPEPIGIIGAMHCELSLLLTSIEQLEQAEFYGLPFHVGLLYERYGHCPRLVQQDFDVTALPQNAALYGVVPFAVIRAISDLADGTAADAYDVLEQQAANHSAATVQQTLRLWTEKE